MLLVAVLAGCATAPRQDFSAVPEAPPSLDETVVAPEVALAPPPEVIVPKVVVVPPPVVTNLPPTVQRNVPPASVPVVETWVPLTKWCASRGILGLTRQTNAPQPTYSVPLPQGMLVVRGGAQSAVFRGMNIRLGFAPQMIGGQPYVHSLDLAKTLEPLLHLADNPVGFAGPIILLDPGHGGMDAGARSVLGGRHEKDFALDWALRLRDLLITQGWQVFLTRTNDVEIPVAARAQLADTLKAALFVSLHFNSAGVNHTESGLETYCLTPNRMPSSLTRGYPDDLNASFPNNAFDAQNLQLAVRAHREVLEAVAAIDRGVRRARFLGVLRPQHRPAILIEGGYLSNPNEARLIATATQRQKLAEAVARAIGAPRQQVAENKP